MENCPGAVPRPPDKQPNVRWEPNLEASSLEGTPLSPMQTAITGTARAITFLILSPSLDRCFTKSRLKLPELTAGKN